MSTTPTKITIREVAAMAGVSTMTVSRVLRNEPQVADKTRQAVREAIATLNYEPLQSARNLSSSVAKVVGLVVPHIADETQTRAGYEYLSGLHLGALNVCNARDYGLMLLHVSEAASVERLVRRARARQVGGFVVAAPATEMPGLISALLQHGIVHAAINPLDTAKPKHWVAADERTAVRELAMHIAAQGHRSIAYIGGRDKIRASRERLAGYKEALRRLAIESRKEWIVQTGITFEDGFAAGHVLLTQASIPSAVQCMTDDLAAGVIAAAHDLGMRLPVDLSVVGFDNFGLARKVWPALTTAHLPAEEMAAHAAAQVIGALEGQPVENRLFPCPVQLRQSVTAPARADSPTIDSNATSIKRRRR